MSLERIERNLHKIARCVHDHVCPSCGSLAFKQGRQTLEDMTVFYECESCKWKITETELKAAMRFGVPTALREALTDFELWRGSLK